MLCVIQLAEVCRCAELCAAMDLEWVHTPEEILAAIPATLAAISDRRQIEESLVAGGEEREIAIKDLCRMAAHDLYRDLHGIEIE